MFVTTGTNLADGASNAANTVLAAVTVSGTQASGRSPRNSGTLGSPAIY